MEEIIARHQSVRLAFTTAANIALYDCTCGRRFSDYAKHVADDLVLHGFGDVVPLAKELARLRDSPRMGW